MFFYSRTIDGQSRIFLNYHYLLELALWVTPSLPSTSTTAPDPVEREACLCSDSWVLGVIEEHNLVCKINKGVQIVHLLPSKVRLREGDGESLSL